MIVATHHPTLLVIFGATGNLAETKIFPSLFHLFEEGRLPKDFHVVAFARKPFSDASFRSLVSSWLTNISDRSHTSFLERIHYVPGDFDNNAAYANLSEKLHSFDEATFSACSNKLLYLAVPPHLYEPILKHISHVGLSIPCHDNAGWTRILLEKPFGNDLVTAQKLDHMLGTMFDEQQIFRIDHYLAKETLQNILAFRFSNGMFEPLWNNKHIAAVDVIMSESHDVKKRGAFYDGVGALKDVGQNHLLQMLALVAMDRPSDFNAEAIRAKRAAILTSLKTPKKEDVVRGQYVGYRYEAGVAPDSHTETAFALKTFLHTPRWAGVPFFLGSGKGFHSSHASITVYFKRPDMCAFGGDACAYENALMFRLHPHEGIEISFLAKQPGFGMELERRKLSFTYHDPVRTMGRAPTAYERVLFDCIKGDQTLFASTAEVDASWSYIAKVIDAWQSQTVQSYDRHVPFVLWARSFFPAGFGDPDDTVSTV